MAALEMMYRAYKIKLAMNRLSRAKEKAVRQHIGLPPKLSCWEECTTAFMDSIRTACCEIFTPCCVFHKPSAPNITIPNSPFKRLMVKGTYENDLLKNCLGFMMGCIITIILYLILIFQMNLSPVVSSVTSTLLGLIFTIGIAFSPNSRLMIFLMIPQFFTSKGRSFLLMYAVILVLNHPVQNFNRNIVVMTESQTCSQEMAFNQTRELAEAVMSPLAGIINVVKLLMDALVKFAQLIKKAFIALKKAIVEIAAAMGALIKWLKSIVSVCNQKMGEPYRKCTGAFDSAHQRCKDALGIFSFVCDVMKVVRYVCYICKIADLLCIIAGLIKDLIVSAIVSPVESAIDDIKTMFDFNVTVDYHYEYNMTQTKTYSQVRKDIVAEIKERMTLSKDFLGFVSDTLFLTIFFVFIRAVIYRQKYLTNDRFDNFYLTYKVMEVNERRKQMGKETVFPLTNKEKGKYIESTSKKLAKSERRKMMKGIILLVIAGCHTCFYLMNDYGLWWLLMMMQKHLAKKITHNVPPHLKMHVQGKGAMSDMYRSMVSMFDPVAETGVELDPTECLPYPYEPNWKIYDEIGIIYGVCFFLVIFESYGLRLRHIICGLVYPKREKERGVWLFNHILKTRGGFLKYKRRKARQQFSNRKNLEEASMIGKLAAKYPIMAKLFKYFGWDNKTCLLCGREGRKNDMDNFSHCVNKDCEAVYCTECFLEINNLCTVCMNPVDYGDLSDYSEERDSSEDEKEYLKKKAEAKKRREDRLAEAAKTAAENTQSQVLLRLGFTGMPMAGTEEPNVESNENDNLSEDLSSSGVINNNAWREGSDIQYNTHLGLDDLYYSSEEIGGNTNTTNSFMEEHSLSEESELYYSYPRNSQQ